MIFAVFEEVTIINYILWSHTAVKVIVLLNEYGGKEGIQTILIRRPK